VSPLAVCVLPGGTVTFTNSDTVPHDIQSGTACPELNLGPIPPSQDRAVTFPAVGVCTYRDQNDPANAAFQGTVAVADAPVIGPGY
jgi:plastocyanin